MKDPIQALYDSMNEEAQDAARHHTSPPRRFRASESSDCVRQIWHRLRGDRPAPRNAEGNMYGILGDVDHDVTRQLLNHHGIPVGGVTFDADTGEATENLLVRTEVPVQHQGRTVTVTVTSRADGTIVTPRGKAILEIKGMGFYMYDWLNKAYTKGGHDGAMERIRSKHQKYVDQCQVTMGLTGYKLCYLLVKDRSTGTLGLHNKETGERTGLYIQFDPERYEEILQRFAYIQSKLEADTPPIAEFADGSQQCGWCPFYYRCHGARDGKIVYPGPTVEESHDHSV